MSDVRKMIKEMGQEKLDTIDEDSDKSPHDDESFEEEDVQAPQTAVSQRDAKALL